jgi:hypothetical protein
LGLGKQQTLPRITEKNGETVLADLTAGTKAVYKYFDLSKTKKITLDLRGDAVIRVNGNVADENACVPLSGGERETLEIEVVSGKTDLISFRLEAET